MAGVGRYHALYTGHIAEVAGPGRLPAHLPVGDPRPAGLFMILEVDAGYFLRGDFRGLGDVTHVTVTTPLRLVGTWRTCRVGLLRYPELVSRIAVGHCVGMGMIFVFGIRYCTCLVMCRFGGPATGCCSSVIWVVPVR